MCVCERDNLRMCVCERDRQADRDKEHQREPECERRVCMCLQTIEALFLLLCVETICVQRKAGGMSVCICLQLLLIHLIIQSTDLVARHPI